MSSSHGTETSLRMEQVRDLREVVRDQQIDFLDFGCSKGGSLELGEKTFGGRKGLGIDIDPTKVAATSGSGKRAVVADATDLQIAGGSVRFTMMMHFLEHLPTASLARTCIASACRVSRDFVFLRHPWFDGDFELFRLGLKPYWTDWSGHTNHFGITQIFHAFQRNANTKRFIIFGYDRILNTRSPLLLQLAAPRNSQTADPEEAQARHLHSFRTDVFREVACLAQTGESFDIETLLPKLRPRHEVIFDSAGKLSSQCV